MTDTEKLNKINLLHRIFIRHFFIWNIRQNKVLPRNTIKLFIFLTSILQNREKLLNNFITLY